MARKRQPESFDVPQYDEPEIDLSFLDNINLSDPDPIPSQSSERGMMYKFDRNDHRRLRARCKKEGCEWYVYVSPMQGDKSWQVKGYNPTHSKFSWNYHNSNIKSGWFGKTFVNKFKDNPKLGTNEFMSEICSTLKGNISKQQAYRAKQIAVEILQGSLKEQFSTIRDYCLELIRSNPGSTVIPLIYIHIHTKLGEGEWLAVVVGDSRRPSVSGAMTFIPEKSRRNVVAPFLWRGSSVAPFLGVEVMAASPFLGRRCRRLFWG
ncbi:hypothetical protein Salat_1418900 [Sesamum alatum]|uniref:Transposase MuDR plant domain-containing protein n=1 Tax=Sesamum alatum TaxID=300844 RepID=A0AAE1YAA5_9LAMI|nr:hypothetical protein Salat_1418900 [Sesamum alatum]